MNGAQQRAELFADVDELKAWKNAFDMKQRELIAWMASVDERIMKLQSKLSTTIEGCMVLIETDTELGNRIDIANKRLRNLENHK